MSTSRLSEILTDTLKTSRTFQKYYGHKYKKLERMQMIVTAWALLALVSLLVFFAAKGGMLPDTLRVPCMLIAILGALAVCVWHVLGYGYALRHLRSQYLEARAIFLKLDLVRAIVSVEGWNELAQRNTIELADRIAVIKSNDVEINDDLFARIRTEVDKEIPAEA